MNQSVIEYLGTLVGYPVDSLTLQRIAIERGLQKVNNWSEITLRQRNLVIADILFVLFTSPSNTGTTTKSHGDFTVTVGGTILTDKNDIYALMMKLYNNPDGELYELLDDVGGCEWME